MAVEAVSEGTSFQAGHVLGFTGHIYIKHWLHLGSFFTFSFCVYVHTCACACEREKRGEREGRKEREERREDIQVCICQGTNVEDSGQP